MFICQIYSGDSTSSSGDLAGHTLMWVENFNLKEVSVDSPAMVHYLQPESRCLLCNSLLLQIDLIDRFGIRIRYRGNLACPLNAHSLLVYKTNELFALFIRNLDVIVLLLCHLVDFAVLLE